MQGYVKAAEGGERRNMKEEGVAAAKQVPEDVFTVQKQEFA